MALTPYPIRLDPEMIQEIERWAADQGAKRGKPLQVQEAIRELIKLGLVAAEKEHPR